jgi:hypothetical protein
MVLARITQMSVVLILFFLLQILATTEAGHEDLKIKKPRQILNRKPYNISLKVKKK